MGMHAASRDVGVMLRPTGAISQVPGGGRCRRFVGAEGDERAARGPRRALGSKMGFGDHCVGLLENLLDGVLLAAGEAHAEGAGTGLSLSNTCTAQLSYSLSRAHSSIHLLERSYHYISCDDQHRFVQHSQGERRAQKVPAQYLGALKTMICCKFILLSVPEQCFRTYLSDLKADMLVRQSIHLLHNTSHKLGLQ